MSAIDAFRKLRDDPNAQLLDIRDQKNVRFLKSPNLKMFEKEVAQVEFAEDGNEDEFVNKVLGRFKDAPNTVICIRKTFRSNFKVLYSAIFLLDFFLQRNVFLLIFVDRSNDYIRLIPFCISFGRACESSVSVFDH